MSIKVSEWVWKHANNTDRHRGTVKLLLLALADHANDSGICWPSAATLADKIGETERHTRRLLKELVEAGDLLVAKGGGRGNTTKYGIAVGLSAKQRERLNSVLQNTVSENTVLQNTDKENSDIPAQKQCPTGTETVTSGHADEVPNSASERAKPAQKREDNRHRTVIEPLSLSTDSDKELRLRAVRAPPSTEHQQLMAAYQDWLGYPIPHGAKEGAAAKKLLKAGYTLEQIDACYHELKSQKFHAEKHVSLQHVYEQIGAVVTAQKAQTNGRSQHQPVRQPVTRDANGHQWRAGSAANRNGSAARDVERLPQVQRTDSAPRDDRELPGQAPALLE